MMMMLMAMRILFARTIMVIIRLAGDDQNYPFFKDPDDPFFSRTLVIVIIFMFGRNNRALKSLSGGSKVVLNQ